MRELLQSLIEEMAEQHLDMGRLMILLALMAEHIEANERRLEEHENRYMHICTYAGS